MSISIPTTELEARMRPCVLSQGGFLGEKESLKNVISRDDHLMADLGITHEEMAEKLDILIRAAEASPSRNTRLGHFRIEVKIYTGFQICPWSPDIHHSQCQAGGGVHHASVDWYIKNIRSGQEMSGPGLAVHLIRDHHFFEGFESPYRINPKDLARLLELGPFRV